MYYNLILPIRILLYLPSMFYVTGQSVLSSFADYHRNNNATTAVSSSSTTSTSPVTIPVKHEQDGDEIQPIEILKEQEKNVKLLTLYPAILMASILLSVLSYLYTFLLTPMMMKTTTEALGNGLINNNNTNNNNDTHSGPPLMIDCPLLTPRQPARKISDLRADDIKVIIGIGDSVMAGFGAKGVINQNYISLNTIKEARGVSFAMGGDQGIVSLPNLIQYYSHDLYGSSIGEQIITVCFGDQFCPVGQYKESIDVLNAAQSGARSLNLNHELDYLLQQLDKAYKNNQAHSSDWKLMTIFIGSNDICHACVVNSSLPAPYTINVQQAIERIRLTIPNVLVQLVGMIRVDEIFTATQAYPSYCQPFAHNNFVLHDHECMCAHSETNRTIMAQLVPQYNDALQKVAAYYQSPMYANDSFAVVYHPLPVDVNTFPIQAISDVDCFHPSALAHEWFAKKLWQMMYTPSSQIPQVLTFEVDAPIYCPKDSDRLQLR